MLKKSLAKVENKMLFVQTDYPFLPEDKDNNFVAPWRIIELVWCNEEIRYAFYRYENKLYNFKKWYMKNLDGTQFDFDNFNYGELPVDDETVYSC